MDRTPTETVWIANHFGHDISAAAKFGTIKILIEGKVETFNIDDYSRRIHEALENSRPEDWLAPSGSVILCIIAALDFARRHGKLNLLIWHAAKKFYVPRRLVLPDGDYTMDTEFIREVIES